MENLLSAPADLRSFVSDLDKFSALFLQPSSFTHSSTAMALISSANTAAARRSRRNTNTDGGLLNKSHSSSSSFNSSSSNEEIPSLPTSTLCIPKNTARFPSTGRTRSNSKSLPFVQRHHEEAAHVLVLPRSIGREVPEDTSTEVSIQIEPKVLALRRARSNFATLTCGLMGGKKELLTNFDDVMVQVCKDNIAPSRSKKTKSRNQDSLQISVEVMREEWGSKTGKGNSGNSRRWSRTT